MTSVTVNRLHETFVTWKLIFSSTLLCNFGRCGLFTFFSLGPSPLYPLWLPPTSQALQCSSVVLPCVCPLHRSPLGATASLYFNFQRITNNNAFQCSCAKFLLSPLTPSLPLVARTKPWTPKCNLWTFQAGFHELNDGLLIKIFQHCLRVDPSHCTRVKNLFIYFQMTAAVNLWCFLIWHQCGMLKKTTFHGHGMQPWCSGWDHRGFLDSDSLHAHE